MELSTGFSDLKPVSITAARCVAWREK